MGNGNAGPVSYVPTGWSSVVPGLRKDHPLRYFTPTPLSVLMGYLRSGSRQTTPWQPDFPNQALACLVYGAMTRRRFGSASTTKSMDTALSQYRDYVLSRGNILTFERLIAVAVGLAGPVAMSLRRDLVYAGPVAHPTSLLYAKEDEVAPLIEDLIEVLTADNRDAEPYELAATTVLCFLAIHPFLDGNGRVARFLAAFAAGRVSDPCSGAIFAGLQYWRRAWFESIAIKARNTGLQDYLDACNRKKSSVVETLGRNHLLQDLGDLAATIAVLEEGRPNLKRLLLEGMLFGTISTQSLKRHAKLSGASFDILRSELVRTNTSGDMSGALIDFLHLQGKAEEGFTAYDNVKGDSRE